jgi:hypothetical protein
VSRCCSRSISLRLGSRFFWDITLGALFPRLRVHEMAQRFLQDFKQRWSARTTWFTAFSGAAVAFFGRSHWASLCNWSLSHFVACNDTQDQSHDQGHDESSSIDNHPLAPRYLVLPRERHHSSARCPFVNFEFGNVDIDQLKRELGEELLKIPSTLLSSQILYS